MRRIALIAPFIVLLLTIAAAGQHRDYLTDEEIELVRDAQQMDKRVEVLTKAVDRRFAALGLNVGGEPPKKSEAWGDPPKGTRTELLSDIKKILQKAADDIDNLATRPDSMVVEPPEPGQKKPKNQMGFKEIITLAVNKLAAAAARYRPVVEKELDGANDRAEVGILLAINDLCGDMIAAPANLSGLK